MISFFNSSKIPAFVRILFLTLSMVLFSYTKKGRLAEKDLEETSCVTISSIDKCIYLATYIIVGGFFFVKSLLCLLKA